MKSLQTQYNLIKEGKGNKEVFVKSAKAQFPTIPNHYGFNETVNELKHKNILNETMLGIVSAQPATPDWFKIFNENVYDPDQEYAFSNKELIAKSSITNKSIMDIYNMLSEIDDIDFIQEIGIIISRKDWNNRGEFANKQRIYKEIQKHLNDENIINDLGEELYKQIKQSSSKLNEAKAEEKKPTKEVVDMETRGFDYKDKKNIDNVYGEEFLKGFYTEMNDPKNEEKTVEELKSIVAKNLAKDQLHYVKDGQFGTKGVGYTTEHPGLGTPKEAKGKYKSSGYGDLKEGKYKKEGWLVKSNNDDTKYIAVHTSDVENKANRISDIYKDKKLAIKKADELNKKLRESETRSVGSMVKPEGFQVGDKVKYKGMNHEITRIVDDRIYIKNLRYGGRPDTWVKAVDLKKSLKENQLSDIVNQLMNAPKGSKATGGGYGPFIKISSNSWKNTKSNSLQHSRALADFIGGFSDFKISSSTNESKLRSAIHQFIKEELNRGKL